MGCAAGDCEKLLKMKRYLGRRPPFQAVCGLFECHKFFTESGNFFKVILIRSLYTWKSDFGDGLRSIACGGMSHTRKEWIFMKRKYLVLMLSLMISAAAVTGCGSGSTQQTAQSAAAEEEGGQAAAAEDGAGAEGKGGRGANGPQEQMNMVRGEVTAISEDSITIQDENGESQTIATGADTSYTKMEMGGMPEGMEKPGDGQMPEGMEKPEDGQMPEGMEKPGDGEMPEGMEKPADGEAPEMPEGGKQGGGRQGGMPEGEEIAWSDIQVGDTVMIMLGEDESAASISLMSGQMPEGN